MQLFEYDDNRPVGKAHNPRLTAEHIRAKCYPFKQQKKTASKHKQAQQAKARVKAVLPLIRPIAPKLADMLAYNAKLGAQSWHTQQALRASEYLLAGDWQTAIRLARAITGIPERELQSYPYVRAKTDPEAQLIPRVYRDKPLGILEEMPYPPVAPAAEERWESDYQPIDIERDPLKLLGSAYNPPTLE